MFIRVITVLGSMPLQTTIGKLQIKGCPGYSLAKVGEAGAGKDMEQKIENIYISHIFILLNQVRFSRGVRDTPVH